MQDLFANEAQTAAPDLIDERGSLQLIRSNGSLLVRLRDQPETTDTLSTCQHYMTINGQRLNGSQVQTVKAWWAETKDGAHGETPLVDEMRDHLDNVKAKRKTGIGHFPQWLDKKEARIINKLITAAKKRGFCMKLHDGEDYATNWTSSRKTVQKATAQTDETAMYLADEGMSYIGGFVLIHGNGDEVISDIRVSRDHPEALEIMQTMSAEAEA